MLEGRARDVDRGDPRSTRQLTPLAAAGLVIIMIGATVITVMGGDVATALVPLIVGLLSGWVAYGRWRLVPLSRRSNGAKATAFESAEA